MKFKLNSEEVIQLEVLRKKEKGKQDYIKITVLLHLHHGYSACVITQWLWLGIGDNTVYA